ncbi:unnamed protein product [Caenorhabditis bovis]|uniref:DZF domain-containing protein n=1 Tax=Caenorhabditis bovis TaxID=2654633 RepID=A0A8S1F5N5_9PELO|nr:unnamed protein product [Caenorhabditis bovis]
MAKRTKVEDLPNNVTIQLITWFINNYNAYYGMNTSKFSKKNGTTKQQFWTEWAQELTKMGYPRNSEQVKKKINGEVRFVYDIIMAERNGEIPRKPVSNLSDCRKMLYDFLSKMPNERFHYAGYNNPIKKRTLTEDLDYLKQYLSDNLIAKLEEVSEVIMYGGHGSYGGYPQQMTGYGYPPAPGYPPQTAAATAAAYSAYSYGYGTAAAQTPTGVPNIADTYNPQNMYMQPQGSASTNYYTASKKAATVSNTNYSNYDAAVYAAATSYLSSKATGSTKSWMSKSATTGTFPTKKRFGIGANSGGDSNHYYCEICKISCAGAITYKEHIEGQRHKKREALEKGNSSLSLPKNKLCYRCELCNVTCSGQDSYLAHVKGAKHMKALSLCKKLGKPIPENAPTIIAPNETGGTRCVAAKPAITSGPELYGVKKVVGINTVNFVGGSKLSTTGQLEETKAKVIEAVSSAGKPSIEVEDPKIQALMAAEEVKPVGEDKVIAQKDAAGKLIQYHCTLCDCKFSDPNAKEIHIKGRRHRLSYKQKVDPTLVVDLKPSSKRNREQIKTRKFSEGSSNKAPIPRPNNGPIFGSPSVEMRRMEVLDERHIEEKHISLFPGADFMANLECMIVSIEGTLKSVSEEYEKQYKLANTATIAADGKDEKRTLQGVIRVGIYAKGIFIKGDSQVDLVVLCSEPPTTIIRDRVKEIFEKVTSELTIETDDQSASCLIVKSNSFTDIRCRVMFTCPLLRDAPPDVECADRTTCVKALAYIRRSKWFIARCVYLNSCQKVLHLMRDMKKRIECWSDFDGHILELLVEKVLSNCPTELNPNDAFRRVLEAIATGVLLHASIHDPCEKEKTNVFEQIPLKKRFELTSSAQNAIRLISFNQMYKVLGIERLPDIRPSLTTDRKRSIDNGDNEDSVDVKREKFDNDVKMEGQNE